MKTFIMHLLLFQFFFAFFSNHLIAKDSSAPFKLNSEVSTKVLNNFKYIVEDELDQKSWYGIYMKGNKIGYGFNVLKKYKKYFLLEDTVVMSDEGLNSTNIVNKYFDIDTGKFIKCSSKNLSSDGKQNTIYNSHAVRNKLIIKNTSGLNNTIPWSQKYNIANSSGFSELVWIKSQPKIGDKSYSYDLDCETGKLHKIKNKLLAKNNFLFKGINSVNYKVLSDALELGTSETLFKDNGQNIETKLGFVKIINEEEKIAKSKIYSLSINDLTNTSIKKPIDDVKKISLLSLELKTLTPIEIKNSFQQLIKRKDKNTYLISLGSGTNFREKFNKIEYEKTLNLSSKYPVKSSKITNVLKILLKGAKNDKEKLHYILAYVSNILIDSYTANTDDAIKMLDNQKGDCTEHAILFTTLARAAGIPAREVSGLIYNDDNEAPGFLAHAWAESVLDGEWIALDPLWRENTINATHIKLDQLDFLKISEINIIEKIYNYSASNKITNKAELEYDKKNFKKAFLLYENLAKKGDLYAQYYLGWAFEYGKGIEANYNKALEWYSKASNQGDDESEYQIANLYKDKNKLGINTNLSSFWFEKSAFNGNKKAAYYIAEAYNNGIGVPLDKDEAIKWYKTAAESIFD